jgi:hypothetical protein
MQDLTPDAEARLAALAARYGVPLDAATLLLRAVAQGHGTQAQFNHPALGGMGQWQPGMIMIGDMFNNGLKARIDAICQELGGFVRSTQVYVPLPPGTAAGGLNSANWWPAELGSPSTAGAQPAFVAANRPAAQHRGPTLQTLACNRANAI